MYNAKAYKAYKAEFTLGLIGAILTIHTFLFSFAAFDTGSDALAAFNVLFSAAALVLGFVGAAQLNKNNRNGGVLLTVAGGLTVFAVDFYQRAHQQSQRLRRRRIQRSWFRAVPCDCRPRTAAPRRHLWHWCASARLLRSAWLRLPGLLRSISGAGLSSPAVYRHAGHATVCRHTRYAALYGCAWRAAAGSLALRPAQSAGAAVPARSVLCSAAGSICATRTAPAPKPRRGSAAAEPSV